MVWSKVEAETIVRNPVSVITATLPPASVVRLPTLRAMLLPCALLDAVLFRLVSRLLVPTLFLIVPDLPLLLSAPLLIVPDLLLLLGALLLLSALLLIVLDLPLLLSARRVLGTLLLLLSMLRVASFLLVVGLLLFRMPFLFVLLLMLCIHRNSYSQE
jgi:hypothetical protein